MVRAVKRMSSTLIDPTTTFTDMLTCKYISAIPGPTIVSATTDDAIMNAAYSTMTTARTTLTTPDLPPAEECHHMRQCLKRGRASVVIGSPPVAAASPSLVPAVPSKE
jgi:hypothetical protein